MKHFAVCLALAVTCGVAFTWNTTNLSTQACSDAKKGINQAREAIIAQNKRMYTDVKEVQRLEAEIANLTNQITIDCSAEEVCAIVKSEINYAEDGIIAEKKRMYTDDKAVAKFGADIIRLKELLTNNCDASEICQSFRIEINKTREVIAAENKKMYTDARVIAKLEDEIVKFKQVTYYKCTFNESCTFGKEELAFARDAIVAEKKKIYSDAKVIEKLEADAANSTEIILNTCDTTAICSFVEVEIKKAEADISAEKRRIHTDSKVVAKLEAYIVRLKTIDRRCGGNSGFMRLAEVAVRSGRFLAKLLKH